MKTENNWHTVLVDFYCEGIDADTLEEQFRNADYIEKIGDNQYQVGLGVSASNEGEAYRRGANLTEAVLAASGSPESELTSATVYWDSRTRGESVTFDCIQQ